MKIAFLTFNAFVYESSFSAIAELLLGRGHEVAAFYHAYLPAPKNSRVQYKPGAWWNFELSSLEQFNPDRILIFNGSFVWCHAATAMIKKRWKTLFAELAWLPQSNHIYIDSEGPGARSLLFRTPTQSFSMDNSETIREQIAPYYTPGNPPVEGEYILVPLQLEADTSILWDSPHFKSMHSLVGFVRRAFPEQRILVKAHPLNPTELNFPGVEVFNTNHAIKDLFPRATHVIGINSTVLIESALVYKKPTMALGLNVACNRGVFYEGKEALENPRGFLNYQPNLEKINACLQHLHPLQFPCTSPPVWVAEKIES